jgi:hypothetical protein
MRLIMLIPALFGFSVPAAAQSWQEYSYPDHAFSISFPAAPRIETMDVQVAGDRKVEARVYSVRRDDAEFTVTVAEIGEPAVAEKAIIDPAIETLSRSGEVKVNIPHRVNRVYGRQLSIVEKDGSRVSAALFDYNGRLYRIEGRSRPNRTDATADTIRFVQSLIFTGGGSNRSADELRAAARAACDGPAGPGDAGATGAATPDEARRLENRCRRQRAFAALSSTINAGDLSGARQAWSSLGEFQRFGNPNGPFAQVVSQIGQALQNGDMTAAQQALTSLRSRGGSRQQP